MNATERYINITELLKKFKNGETLYKESALFNQIIQMMIEGMNPYEVIEELIKVTNRTQRAFEDYVNMEKIIMGF